MGFEQVEALGNGFVSSLRDLGDVVDAELVPSSTPQ